MTKHTPVPWKLHKNEPKENEWFITGKIPADEVNMTGAPVECRLADVFSSEANAQLIAFAPILLETSKRYLEITLNPNKYPDDLYEDAKQQLQQAIAKVESVE